MKLIVRKGDSNQTVIVSVSDGAMEFDLKVIGPFRSRGVMSPYGCYMQALRYANDAAKVMHCDVLDRHGDL